MRLRQFTRRATILGLALAVLRAYSLTVLAAGNAPVGDVDVLRNAENAFVTVNGEPVASGRTVFDGSTIVTSAGASATLNLGKAGRIELGPDSLFVLTASGGTAAGTLNSGTARLVSGPQTSFITPAGTVVADAGDSVNAASGVSRRATGGISKWAWVAIIGGAAILVFALTRGGSDDNTGGSVASPVR